MDMKEIEKRTIRIIKEQLYYPEEIVELESTFRGDLGMDSLDEVELVMALEDEFGIDIIDEDAEKTRTVGEAVEYLIKRVMQNHSPEIRE